MKVAYENMICDYRLLKKEKYRVRLTFGGDVLEYEGNASPPAVSLLEAKLIINSVISEADRGAKFMSVDLKDFSTIISGRTRVYQDPWKILPRRHKTKIQYRRYHRR